MKSTEIFNKIASKKIDAASIGRPCSEIEYFSISQKQADWLASQLSRDFSNFNGQMNWSEGQFSYSFDYDLGRWNVPHYIKDYKKYGKTHFIAKWKQ